MHHYSLKGLTSTMQPVQSDGADKPLSVLYSLFFPLVCFYMYFYFCRLSEKLETSWRQIGYIKGTNLFVFFIHVFSPVTLCKQRESLHSRQYKGTNRKVYLLSSGI